MPLYDLDKVKKVALKGDIEYRGRKVQRDINNLNYTMADVKMCFSELSPFDFYKSYVANGQSDDAYRFTYCKLNEDGVQISDNLYIKFRLIDHLLTIDLGSFHI